MAKVLDKRKEEGTMDIDRIKVFESDEIKMDRVLGYFGFIAQPPSYHYGLYIYVKIMKRKNISFFRLFNFTRLVSSKKLLGNLTNVRSLFEVFHRDNLPLASLFIKKLSAELNKDISITLTSEDGQRVEYDVDDPQFLNNRREFLEQEQHRIEDELADVHKKLQALEGDGAPYRRAALLPINS